MLHPSTGSGTRGPRSSTYLKLRVALEYQNIHRLELTDKPVPLELLPQLRPYRRHGHVERVHLLDLGCLQSQQSRNISRWPPYPWRGRRSPPPPPLLSSSCLSPRSRDGIGSLGIGGLRGEVTHGSYPFSIRPEDAVVRVVPVVCYSVAVPR